VRARSFNLLSIHHHLASHFSLSPLSCSSDYDKKKYVWKLLYIHMLGHDVEFGHRQAADLIPAPRYAEKQVGYLACALLLTEKDEFLRLVINSVRSDLVSRNEPFQCLALAFIANVGGAEMASLLTADVGAVLVNGSARPAVRKKAALALLRLVRKAPPEEDALDPDQWAPRLAAILDDERDVGLLLCTVSLILGLVARSYQGYEGLAPRLVALLARLRSRDVSPDYTYYGIASPWLQVKALRALQYFPAPADARVRTALGAALRSAIEDAGTGAKNVNKSNALHAIALEAVSLALAGAGGDDPDLVAGSVGLLGRCVGAAREPNLRYLGLEAMVRLAAVPDVRASVSRHQAAVTGALRDPDVSVRRRALDLLFAMAAPETGPAVVAELLAYLSPDGGCDLSMREDVALRAAVLAERFAPDPTWYADTVLALVRLAGEDAPGDVWRSAVQVVAGGPPGLQAHAAAQAFAALTDGGGRPGEASSSPCSDALLSLAAFWLGEYGRAITASIPAAAQFGALRDRLPAAATNAARGVMLTAFLKIGRGDPALRSDLDALLSRYARHGDPDLQQRAVEYAGLEARPAAAAAGLAPLPPWDRRRSALVRRMAAGGGGEGDEAVAAPAWLADEEGGTGGGVAGASLVSVDGAPPTVHAAPAAPIDPLMDLLSLDVPSPAPPAPAPTASSDDPFATPPLVAAAAAAAAPVAVAVAVAVPVGPPPAASPKAAAASPQAAPPSPPPATAPTPAETAWFLKASTSPSAILYEDEALQVGARCGGFEEGGRGAGTVTLFLGNKGGAALPCLVVRAGPAPPGLEVALSGVAPPPELGPKQQVPVVFTVQATAPTFSAAPRLNIAWGGLSPRTLSLRLPAPPTRFLVQSTTGPVSLAALPEAATGAVTRVSPLAAGGEDAALSSAGLVTTGPGTGAADFVASSSRTPVLVRVVADGARTGVTVSVACAEAALAAGVKEIVCGLLQ